jgi:FkbM family methyltransferase
MQILQKQAPSEFQAMFIESLGHLFRGGPKFGRGAIFKMFFPEGAHFNYDFTIMNYGKPYSGNLKFGIDHHIFFYQIFEPYNINILQTIAQYLKSQVQVVTFLDIGANVGSHSHFMVDYADLIHSFEPHPDIFESLAVKQKTCQSNSFHIHQFGLGDTESKMEYYEPATHNTGTGSFISGNDINQGNSIQLLVKQGDKTLDDLRIKSVSLIKLDVEGFEGFVLRGLTETLKRDRPIILMEMSKPTRNVMAQHHLSLESLLYSDVILFEICPIGKRGKFKLLCQSFETISPEHHDLLVVPIEHQEALMKTFRQSHHLKEY